MVTKGIITGVPTPSKSPKTRKYIVDVYIFKDPGDKSRSKRLSRGVEATVAYTPGGYVEYNVGDRVFVSFEDNDYGHPIIIGKLLLPQDPMVNYGSEISAMKGQIEALKASVANLQSLCSSMGVLIDALGGSKQGGSGADGE